MSYFNEEQQSYMKYLASIPREKRCTCGWYLKGECWRCDEQTEQAKEQKQTAIEHNAKVEAER